MLLNAAVLWVHIFGAIGWLGAAMVFGIIIGPSLPNLSGQARGEFFVNVVPRFLRFIQVFAIVTVIAGVAMVAVLANGDFSIMSPSTSFGLFISAGALLALVVIGISLGVVVPTAHKMVKIAESMAKTPGPPPPDLAALASRLRKSSAVGLVLLILVTVFMVAGANP